MAVPSIPSSRRLGIVAPVFQVLIPQDEAEKVRGLRFAWAVSQECRGPAHFTMGSGHYILCSALQDMKQLALCSEGKHPFYHPRLCAPNVLESPEHRAVCFAHTVCGETKGDLVPDSNFSGVSRFRGNGGAPLVCRVGIN